MSSRLDSLWRPNLLLWHCGWHWLVDTGNIRQCYTCPLHSVAVLCSLHWLRLPERILFKVAVLT